MWRGWGGGGGANRGGGGWGGNGWWRWWQTEEGWPRWRRARRRGGARRQQFGVRVVWSPEALRLEQICPNFGKKRLSPRAIQDISTGWWHEPVPKGHWYRLVARSGTKGPAWA